jgi:ParB family chromosome partitioning protein
VTRPRQTITHIRAELLTAHPDNIRNNLGDLTDLARSIREHGILQPITVTEHRLGGFLILAGHRRFNAGLKAGLDTYPAIIRHGLDDHAEQIVVMLVENTQRRDLDPIEKAVAYKLLIDQGLSQSEIARRVGCSPSTVNYYSSFLDLDDDTIDDVRSGRITAGDARDAVVEARQQHRISQARPQRGRRPNYFGASHDLYDTVRELCTHHDGQIIGNAGCGPCWEQAIVDRFLATHQAAAS